MTDSPELRTIDRIVLILCAMILATLLLLVLAVAP
jgi:hypothetical protein